MPHFPLLDSTEQDTRPRFDEGGLNDGILLPREACEEVLKTGAIYRSPGPVVESGRVSRKYVTDASMVWLALLFWRQSRTYVIPRGESRNQEARSRKAVIKGIGAQ